MKLDKNYNYIVTNKSDTPTWIILNKYKTDYRYGTFKINLQQNNSPYLNFKNLVKNISAIIKNEDMKHLDPFFPTTQKAKAGQINVYPSSQFGTVWLNHVFRNTGKKISVDILRHSFITNWFARNPDASDKTIDLIASYMSHTSSMFRSYRKLNVEDKIKKFIEEYEKD